MPSAAPDRVHYFCCIAGCGLDAAAARRANQMPRWLRRHGGYALALLPLLLKLPAFSMRLTEFNDNQPTNSEKLTLLAAFANTQFYGDGMRIAPQADFADGKLDVCRISTMNPFELFCMFPTVYFGHHLLDPKVGYFRACRAGPSSYRNSARYLRGWRVCLPDTSRHFHCQWRPARDLSAALKKVFAMSRFGEMGYYSAVFRSKVRQPPGLWTEP